MTMSDLDMTRLCAKAMGYATEFESPFPLWESETQPSAIAVLREPGDIARRYDPLCDDAQAMALVKLFDLSFCPRRFDSLERQRHTVILHQENTTYSAQNTDLNRAIVESVAKMMRATASVPVKPPEDAEAQ
jgi:hypothetical protein